MAVQPSALANAQQQSPVQIPRWDKDPAASLTPTSIILDFGETVEIPEQSAAQWLSLFMRDDFALDDILDLIPEWEDLVLKEYLTLQELPDICLEIIEVASSRDWWIALRLVSIAKMAWDTIGPDMITTVNAAEVSLSAWLTVFTPFLLHRMDKDKATSLILQIESPPQGFQAEPAAIEMTASQFMAMAS